MLVLIEILLVPGSRTSDFFTTVKIYNEIKNAKISHSYHVCHHLLVNLM